MGIKFAEFQGRRVLWQGVQIHLKKIYGEFTVDIMEFVFKLILSNLPMPCKKNATKMIYLL